MDAFESIVATILRCEGWWVRNSFRVSLTKPEKRKAGRPTMSGYELDIVAYKGRSNELLVVECKSYLDSPGVRFGAFDGTHRSAKRYKLFNERRLWNIVARALCRRLCQNESCGANPKVRLCLVAGRIVTESDRAQLTKHFERRGWHLFDDRWVAEKLRRLSQQPYTNNESVIAAKILGRFGQSNGEPSGCQPGEPA